MQEKSLYSQGMGKYGFGRKPVQVQNLLPNYSVRGENGRQGTFTSWYFTYNSMKSWVSIAGLKDLELAVFCCATQISKLLGWRFPVIYILLFHLDHRKWPF